MKGWRRKPRIRIGEEEGRERKTTWLELFYDRVFVVVSQIAHNPAGDVSLQNLERPGAIYRELSGANLQIENVAVWRLSNHSPTLQASLGVVRQVTEQRNAATNF